MRYVIVVLLIAVFLYWDGTYNDGLYLAAGVREIQHVRMIVMGWFA